MKKLGWSSSTAFLSGIDRILPGVSSFTLEGDRRKVFQFNFGELSRFEQAGRLGSPTHWRNYFAFSFPTYAITDEELATFRRRATANDGSAAQMILALSEKPHQRQGHFVDVLLDRLADLPAGALSPTELEGIAGGLAATMDQIGAKSKNKNDIGGNAIWSKALRLLKLTKPERFQLTIQSEASVNWFADVIRDQGLAHGLQDNARIDRDRQWLTLEQLNFAIRSFIDRVKEIGAASVFEMPQPLEVLFCWAQLGPKEELSEFFRAAIEQDAGFVTAMDAMRGLSVNSETGVSHPLYREYVAVFTDADAAKSRLEQIAKTGPRELSVRAESVIASWRDQMR